MSIFDIFGGGNTAGDYNQYADQTQRLTQDYSPYTRHGAQAGRWMLPQLHQAVSNPNSLQNSWAQGFQLSPYQQNLLNNVSQHMQAMGANNGMLGSGQLQKALQGQLSNDVGQFQNNYVNRAMQLYGMGLNGLGNTYRTGFNALNNRNSFLDAANQARLQGNIAHDTQLSRDFGGILGTVADIAEIGG